MLCSGRFAWPVYDEEGGGGSVAVESESLADHEASFAPGVTRAADPEPEPEPEPDDEPEPAPAAAAERDAQGQPLETFLCGRYVDRFERRAGEWRVAARTVVYDWVRQTPLPAISDAELFGVRQPTGGRQPNDPLYELLRQAPFAAEEGAA